MPLPRQAGRFLLDLKWPVSSASGLAASPIVLTANPITPYGPVGYADTFHTTPRLGRRKTPHGPHRGTRYHSK